MNRKTLLELLFGQEQKPQLATPTISLDKNILKITNITDAEQYKIYVDSNLSYTLDLNLYQINNFLPILKDVTVQQDGTEVIIL